MGYILSGIVVIVCVVAIVIALPVLKETLKFGKQKTEEEEE